MIRTDLREITNDFNDLVEQCFLQGKRVYEDLRMIASSSKAHIYDGKPQIPMLKMDLPEEMELSEEASRMSIRNEIEKGANEIKEMLVNNFEEKQISLMNIWSSFTRSLVPIQLTCRESSMKSPERRSNDRKYLDVFSSFEYGGSGIWNA